MFDVIDPEFSGVLEIRPKSFNDDRGFFREIGRNSFFKQLGLPDFIQENHSRSKYGVLRGLHYQVSPERVGKLVRCIRGKIFDVAVDIRPESKTYAQWIGCYLDDKNGSMLYVPEGFAHGFCVLSEEADVIYNVTGYYSSKHDRSIRFDDKNINIKWPIETNNLIISDKDLNAPFLKDADPI